MFGVFAVAILAGSGAQTYAAGPAVSGVNGKLEFDAGVLSLGSTPSYMLRGAGSLALPLGDQLGFQGDVTLSTGSSFGNSAAVHVFTRDPDSHLLGATFGFASMPGAMVFAAGPEAELYYGRFSIEAWGGLAHTNYSDPGTPDRTGIFAMGDLAYYPDDDWRLDAGLSLLAGHVAAHVGSEVLLHGFPQPLSLAFDGRVGSDGSVGATAGIKVYFGGGDKSLIARHRQDDPQNRGATLSEATGSVPRATHGGDSGGDPVVPVCLADEWYHEPSNTCVKEGSPPPT